MVVLFCRGMETSDLDSSGSDSTFFEEENEDSTSDAETALLPGAVDIQDVVNHELDTSVDNSITYYMVSWILSNNPLSNHPFLALHGKELTINIKEANNTLFRAQTQIWGTKMRKLGIWAMMGTPLAAPAPVENWWMLPCSAMEAWLFISL